VPPSHYDWLAKIILLGDSGVGKTSVKTRLVDGQFREDAMMISTVGVDMSYKTFKVESDYIKVHIWDTAGQERYRSIAQSYYKGANGIVLVYAVDERQSLEHVDAWLKQILELAPANTKIMLLANKCDYDISKHFISTE
jgi:small GTP-binding protein